MKYDHPESNEWIYPKRKGYRQCCCDCGLVHEIDFRIVKVGKKSYIEIRFRRNERATAAVRRGMK